MNQTTKVAIDAATRAGKLLNHLVGESHTEKVKEKGVPADIVTEADIASNTLIASVIHRQFPNHAILSEETSEVTDPTKHKHLWIVDPIDGTISFAAKLPFYTVSIAYCLDGEVVSGALYMADTQEVLWAETGKGAFVGKKPIHIRNLPWEKSVIGFDPGIQKRKRALTKLAPGLASDIRWLYSSAGSAYMLGLVAKGNLQGSVAVYTSVWDFAAGIHIVREAGGKATDFLGREYPLFTESGYVAATPKTLPHILKYTRKVARYFME